MHHLREANLTELPRGNLYSKRTLTENLRQHHNFEPASASRIFATNISRVSTGLSLPATHLTRVESRFLSMRCCDALRVKQEGAVKKPSRAPRSGSEGKWKSETSSLPDNRNDPRQRAFRQKRAAFICANPQKAPHLGYRHHDARWTSTDSARTHGQHGSSEKGTVIRPDLREFFACGMIVRPLLTKPTPTSC